ncbi:MAG: ATP-binding protein [Chloroflexi bacterium]|nr:ATP-binding protein [Chloroflexota bacterium]
MTPSSRNAYTDSPWLQDGLLVGSVRLLFWLFFHPSAWRNHLSHIDTSLQPQFSLAELKRWQWRQPNMLRLLFQANLVWPLFLLFFIVLILWLLPVTADTIFLGTILGGVSGIVTAVLVSVVGSVTIGIPMGLGIGLVVGIFGSLMLGEVNGLSINSINIPASIFLPALVGIASGLAGGLAFGVAYGVSGHIHLAEPTHSLSRQISGVIIGIIIGVAGGLIATVLRGALFSALAIGMPFGLAIHWRTQQWQKGLLAGCVAGLAGVFLNNSADLSGMTTLIRFFAQLALITSLFMVPYVLAERIAGHGAAAMAGALGGGGGFFLFLNEGQAVIQVLWFSLAGILLGLTLAWWRPVLTYPFLYIFNATLYRLDERRLRDGKRPSLLRHHSAFWDEFQRLPLLNLDNHLLLVMTHRPQEGEAALTYLSTSRQRWAAQAAQIEADAKLLEKSVTIRTIGTVHQQVAAGELTGPASALLRSFSRISQDISAAEQQESAYNQRLALNAVADRLDGLLRELIRSNEPYAIRFRSIASSWRQIVTAHSGALADEAELRQEIDSPYIIGVPLTEQQEIFIGRTDISAHIEQLLLDRRQPPLLLYGQRRVGKTSLLNNLGRLLPSTIVPMFVDLQGPASRAKDEAGFLYNIARSMMRAAMRQRNVLLPPLTRDDLLADPFTRFEEWLDEVEGVLAHQMALLMLDEFEALEQMLQKGRFDEAVILGMLRHLIQHRPRFKVLLAGSHTLEEFQRWSSYLINVQVIHISYLSADETLQLVESPVQSFALRYAPGAAKRLVLLTRGHPFLVQLLCAEVVALKNEQPPTQRRLATLADVETAVPHALQHGSFYFADIEKNQVDMVALEVLRLIAKAGEQTAVSRQTLVDYVPSLMALEEALTALQHRELIEKVEGGYQFQVELIRRWFGKRP